MRKILFLGYSKNKTRLIDYINSKKNYKVDHTSKKISSIKIQNYDAVISFGYRNIIEKKLISKYKKPIINLHISVLPYNRGAHPNFWAFADNTPSGVTIHEIDNNIDTGNIIFQKQIDFELLQNKKKLTFKKTYDYLINEIENLFIKNFKNLINFEFDSYNQMGNGSYHNASDLPKILKSWNQNIFSTVSRYNKNKSSLIHKNLKLLDEIEKTRSKNNINWMNILRTSMKSSPEETLDILKKINSDDQKISKLFREFSK